MKKYIVYYKECYNKEKNLYREFFKIERHPKLDKPWILTDSYMKYISKVNTGLNNKIYNILTSNKEKIIKESNERLKKMKETNPEKLKEYRHKAYLNRKEKLKNENIKEN